MSDQVISAILGTREGAVDAGLHLSSVGVSWTDQIEASALRDALSVYKVENVMLVSAFLAATALGQSVGGAIGYDRTAVLFVEPETATLAIVNTADGSVYDVRRQVLADDDDTAVAEIVELVSSVESMETRPDGVYVVGSGVDITLIRTATRGGDDPGGQRARGARDGAGARRGARGRHCAAVRFVDRRVRLRLDSEAAAAERAAYLRDAPLGEDEGKDDAQGEGELAYSSVPDDVADAETLLHGSRRRNRADGGCRTASAPAHPAGRERIGGGVHRRGDRHGDSAGDRYPPDGRIAAHAKSEPPRRTGAGARTSSGGGVCAEAQPARGVSAPSRRPARTGGVARGSDRSGSGGSGPDRA